MLGFVIVTIKIRIIEVPKILKSYSYRERFLEFHHLFAHLLRRQINYIDIKS